MPTFVPGPADAHWAVLPERTFPRTSWHVMTCVTPRRLCTMPGGSSQQSAPVAHSPLHVFPVGVRPYEAMSHLPLPPETEGTQTRPAPQSLVLAHDSPR